MLARTGRFRRRDRILQSREFSHVLRHGKRHRSRDFVVIAHRSKVFGKIGGAKTRRLGITVSRRVGNAVTRNHVKRAIREWFRHVRMQLPEGVEVVVIARPPARTLTVKQAGDALDFVVRDWTSGEFMPQVVESK